MNTKIPLWPTGAPGFESLKDELEISEDYWIRNIHSPSLTVYQPPADRLNGCAIVVAPGGGFRELVYHAEGEQAAEFLNTLGIVVFVLKYRLPRDEKSPYSIRHVQQDAVRSMQIVRSKAKEYGIDPNRIGMLGFSAGGAVVMLASLFDKPRLINVEDPIGQFNFRPNFQILVYPGKLYHLDLMLGHFIPTRVSSDAPQAFLICANDDEFGCDKTTLDLVKKFRAARVPVELHLLARGRHAFNMGNRSTYQSVRHWPQRLAEWLIDSALLV